MTMSDDLKARLDAMTVLDAEGYTRCLVQTGCLEMHERRDYLVSRDPAYGQKVRGGYVRKWA
jgi:hypothetical protein